jgi:hypothetical protein
MHQGSNGLLHFSYSGEMIFFFSIILKNMILNLPWLRFDYSPFANELFLYFGDGAALVVVFATKLQVDVIFCGQFAKYQGASEHYTCIYLFSK